MKNTWLRKIRLITLTAFALSIWGGVADAAEATSRPILFKKLVPPFKISDQMHSVPDESVFNTPRRHPVDEFDQLQNSPKVKKAVSFYNKYFKIFDLDKAAREGVYEVNIQAEL